MSDPDEEYSTVSMKKSGVKAFRRMKAVIEADHLDGEQLGNAEAMKKGEELVREQVRN